jgi:hypothetical protein
VACFNSTHACRDHRRRQEKSRAALGRGEVQGARLDDASNCSAGTGQSIYATWHIFVCHVATSGDELRRRSQPLKGERVGLRCGVSAKFGT